MIGQSLYVNFVNGQNEYVAVPAINASTNTITITGWINPVSTPNDFAGIVYSRDGSSPWGLGYGGSGCASSNAGMLSYTWNTNDINTYCFVSNLAPPVGKWSFIALTIAAACACSKL